MGQCSAKFWWKLETFQKSLRLVCSRWWLDWQTFFLSCQRLHRGWSTGSHLLGCLGDTWRDTTELHHPGGKNRNILMWWIIVHFVFLLTRQMSCFFSFSSLVSLGLFQICFKWNTNLERKKSLVMDRVYDSTERLGKTGRLFYRWHLIWDRVWSFLGLANSVF